MIARKNRILPIALVPVFLPAITRILMRQNNPDFFLGLSSDFWAGTTIGISIVAAVVAIYLFVSPTKASQL